MKRMNRLSATVLAFTVAFCGMTLLNSCQQTAPQEPTAVTVPSAVPSALLSARIDGQDWSVKGTSSVQAATDRTFYASLNGQNQQELFILGMGGFANSTSVTDRLSLYASGFTGVGAYPLGAIGLGKYAVVTIVGGTSALPTLENYATSDRNTGTLTITKYDATAYKISGTFSFRAESASGSINVTDGQFLDAVIAK
jgi:hypothetical protein